LLQAQEKARIEKKQKKLTLPKPESEESPRKKARVSKAKSEEGSEAKREERW
jgi:hypothetical protein